MQTTDQWLNEKVEAYNKNPKEALEDMLISTTEVIEHYLENPGLASKGLLEVCVEHNNLFFGVIESEIK